MAAVQQGDADGGADAGDECDAGVFSAKGSVFDGVGGEMGPVDRPKYPGGQHGEDDEENEVAIPEEAPDDHVDQADEEEDEEHAEDDIGDIQKGGRKIVSAAAEHYIINKTDQGIDDADEKTGHYGPVCSVE